MTTMYMAAISTDNSLCSGGHYHGFCVDDTDYSLLFRINPGGRILGIDLCSGHMKKLIYKFVEDADAALAHILVRRIRDYPYVHKETWLTMQMPNGNVFYDMLSKGRLYL